MMASSGRRCALLNRGAADAKNEDKEDRVLDHAIDCSTQEALRCTLYTACSKLFWHFEDPSAARGQVADKFNVLTVQGGITNQLYKCTIDGARPILVRIYGAKTDEVIDRKRENLVVNTLSRKGFGPGIFGRVRNGRLEEFLPGRCLTPELMVQDDIMNAVAHRLAQMHSMTDIPLSKEPGLWVTLEGWLGKVRELTFEAEHEASKRAEFAKIDLAAIGKEIAELKAVISASTHSPVVFAHNDLLSGNVMWDSEARQVTLVDYEYGCYNYRGFDLANHFCECCGFDCDWGMFPDRAKQAVFGRAYLSEVSGCDEKSVSQAELDALYDEVQPFVLAAHLFWGVWALIQAKYSPIDFDYLGYSKMRLAAHYAMKTKCLLSHKTQ